MDGLEAVEIKLSEVLKENIEFRIDSEFFKKEYLQYDNIINKLGYHYINDFATVTDGIHESIDFDENSNINLISAKSPKQNVFDLSGNGYISNRQHEKNPRTELKDKDVIISTVGTIGNCAVVNKAILPANCDRHVGIIRVNKKFSPYYISTFMLTKYGLSQSIRHSTGNVQLNLFIYKIKNIKIPNSGNKFQEIIEKAVIHAHELLDQSTKLYKQAEEMLLSEIGFKENELNNKNISIKTLSSSFNATGRLDAEYYQPKYDEIEKLIKINEHSVLAELVTINKSIEPGSDFYVEEGIPFVRVSNLNKYGITMPDIKIAKDIVTNISKLFLKKDTILLSKDGSVGIAYKVNQDMDMVTSGAILHLKIKNKSILPDYLTLVLNSLIVQLQAERDAGGSIIQHWKPSEIEKVLIPILSLEIQKRIGKYISNSFKLRENSEKLLTLAKQAVEMAIEEGELTAIKWIEEKMKDITKQ